MRKTISHSATKVNNLHVAGEVDKHLSTEGMHILIHALLYTFANIELRQAILIIYMYTCLRNPA